MRQDKPFYISLKAIAVLLGCSHRLVKHLVKTGRIEAVRGSELEEMGLAEVPLRGKGYYWRNSWWVTVDGFLGYLMNVYRPDPDVMDSILSALGDLIGE